MDQARKPLVTEPPAPIAAVDFDLTLVDSKEKILPGAKEALSYLKGSGWTVIVWTTREDLRHVRDVLTANGVPFDFINENPETDVGKFPRKMYFDVTVDDKAIPFQGDWTKIVGEMERRRAAWKVEGETKDHVRLKTATRDGDKTLAVFSMRDGRVVFDGEANPLVDALMKSGIETEEGAILKPEDGVVFLKALSDIRGTYLWSEIF